MPTSVAYVTRGAFFLGQRGFGILDTGYPPAAVGVGGYGYGRGSCLVLVKVRLD